MRIKHTRYATAHFKFRNGPLADADVAGQISLRPADPLAAGFRRSGLSRGLLGPLGLDHIRVTRDHFSQPFPRIPDGQRRYWPDDNEPVAQPNEIQSRYLVAVADGRIAGALARFPGGPSSNPARRLRAFCRA
jgi:hypothetical protein